MAWSGHIGSAAEPNTRIGQRTGRGVGKSGLYVPKAGSEVVVVSADETRYTGSRREEDAKRTPRQIGGNLGKWLSVPLEMRSLLI